MKAPSVAPITATQVLVETVVAAGALGCAMVEAGPDGTAVKAGRSVVMRRLLFLAKGGCIRQSVSIISGIVEALSGRA
jgi:hypothetical protein